MNRRGFLRTALATSAMAGPAGFLAGASHAGPRSGSSPTAKSPMSDLTLGVHANDEGLSHPPALLARAADVFHQSLTRDGDGGSAPALWTQADQEPDILIAAGDFGSAHKPELALFGGVPLAAKHVSAAHMSAWIEQSGALDLWRDLMADLGWHPIPVATFDADGLVTIEGAAAPTDRKIAATGLGHAIATQLGGPQANTTAVDLAERTTPPAGTLGLSPETILRVFGSALQRLLTVSPISLEQHQTAGLTVSSPVVAAFVSRSVWDRLDPDTRRVLELAGRAAMLSHMGEQTLFRSTIAPSLLANGRLQIVRRDDQTHAPHVRRAAEAVIADVQSGRETATLYRTLATVVGADISKTAYAAFPTV